MGGEGDFQGGGPNLSWEPAPTFGEPGQGWAPPGASDGSPGNSPTPAHRGAGRLVAAGAVAALLLAAAGYGGYALGVGRGSPGPATANQSIPSPASGSGGTNTSGSMNASRIAAEVDPGVVDVVATDGYQGQVSAGTGMILTANGEVLTNNHVIAGATQITVQVAGSGPKYKATVVGTDVTGDVALLQVQGAPTLRTVKVGNSSTVTVGQPVVAIGNALDLPGPPTVTQGIISALNRSISASDSGSGASENLTGMLQTDATLEPGNSGGPLVDSGGGVVGMNTAAATGSAGRGASASTVGFAIPINRALGIASRIQKGESSSTIQIGPPAFIGVSVANVSSQGGSSGGSTAPVSAGAEIVSVVPGTPAAKAGLAAGDVITAFAGKSIKSVSQLRSAVLAAKPGQSVSVGWVGLSGGRHSATITLASGPPE